VALPKISKLMPTAGTKFPNSAAVEAVISHINVRSQRLSQRSEGGDEVMNEEVMR
jgi:hypothetical protein